MEKFYERFVVWDTTKTSEDQLYALCPLHEEDTASFTVNRETGAWYCHGCQQGGHYVEFTENYYGVARDTAVTVVKQWEKNGSWAFPDEETLDKQHKLLLKRDSYRDELYSFGITDDIIKELYLGAQDIFITFPIYSTTGRCVNIRKYCLPSKRENEAKVTGIASLNVARFYPLEAFEQDTIYIVEGEKDMASARSQGLNAVTSTGGSGLPRNEWVNFKGKHVKIMTDTDRAGDKIAANYLKHLDDIAESIVRIRLPVKDFADYWMAYKNADVDQFEETMANRRPKKVENVKEAISLIKSEDVDNIGTWIRLDNMSIVGTDPKTFTIPCTLSLRCGHQGGACSTPCLIATSREPEILDVNPREMVMFVNSSDKAQDNYLKKLFGCKDVLAVPEKMVNVQKILFQETASFVEGLEDASFDHRFGIYCYDRERLRPTSKYDMEAMRVTDPRSQQNYFVVRKTYTASSSLEGLGISDETLIYLQNLASGAKNVHDLINAHYDLWLHKLGIEGRPDLFGVLMLTTLSVTELRWKAGKIKGWLDSMVIGDTRTGKSQMAQRFVKLLGMGSYINGENSRRTGVIGGVQRFDDSWVITWGAIPLNDRGMLVIDEASGLDIEDIKELSATRSSGAVSINKIAKGEARARTRLLWLSNPRSGRNLDEFYWKGFGAFQEFIPVAEDQARYDLVISAARDDVDVSLFEDEDDYTDKPLGLQHYREAAAFAWSVEAEDVICDKEAIKCVKKHAIELENKYGGGPLIVGVAVHEKILRLGAAIAILSGSVKSEPRQVHITTTHIEYAVDFLKSTLTKLTFDYASYIREQKKSLQERTKNIDFIKAQIGLHPALSVLLSANVFRGVQMREILGLSGDESSKLLSEFLKRGLIRMTNQGAYAPDKMMIDIVKQIGGTYE